MRKLFVVGLAALLVATTAMVVGCGKSTTKTPPTMEVPKEGPTPVGGGGGGGAKGKEKVTVPGGTQSSSD
jgi:hypothetical protein